MTIYNFDELIDRRQSDSVKWGFFGEDVLPMWVADMDFRSPEPVVQALHERVEHGVFGYGWPPKSLSEVICERMERLYQWTVTPEQIMLLPGLVSGFNVICRAVGGPSDGVLVQTPLYPPMLHAPHHHEQLLQTADLTLVDDGQTIHYEVDFDAFEAIITPQTKLFILCHPHNPGGVSFSVETLTKLAEICARHNIIICSDEIHGDLLLDGTKHTPMASISPDISQQTITLMAPSKTFNVPGLGCSFAIIQNPELFKQVEKAKDGIVPWVNLLGFHAALAAYQHGDEWLTQLLTYLTANRDATINYIVENMPGIKPTVPTATYLTWLDCRQSGIEGSPHKFFLEQAKVGLNDGATFGQAGEGFVRFNFAAPRQRVVQALSQMKEALESL